MNTFGSDVYYLKGSGMHTFQSDLYYLRGKGRTHRGGGLGAIFGRIFRHIVPSARLVAGVAKKAAKSKTGQAILKKAKREALKAGINLASDVLKGKNVLQSSKKHLKTAVSRVGQKTVKRLQSLGKAKVPARKKRRVKTYRKRRVGGGGDFFD